MVKLQRQQNVGVGEYKSRFDEENASQTQTPHTLNKAETAAYISDVALQLRNMAKSADLKFLAYFLEMSFQEAFSQSIGKGKEDD